MDAPDWIWSYKTRMSAAAKAVYASLLSYRQRDAPTQEVWPSLATLAEDSGHSRDVVRRKAIPELEAAGLIVVLRTKAAPGDGPQKSNRFTVAAPESRPRLLEISANEQRARDDQRHAQRAERRAARKAAAQETPGATGPGGVRKSTDPGATGPTPGATSPGPQGLPAPLIPAIGIPTKEPVTPTSLTRSAAGADLSEIEDIDGAVYEVGERPSADDAAAPRADDGDGGGSVVEAGEGSSVVDAIRDVGEPSERQLAYMRDLYVMAYGQAPDWKVTGYMRRLDQAGVSRYVRELYAVIPGRTGYYDGPQLGDEAYELLSPRGKQWADAALDPDDLEAIFAIGPGEASS